MMYSYLLSLGAQCDSLDFENKTPLHYAALNSRSGIIKLLLTHLDDPDMKDGNGMTPLHYSCLLGDTTVSTTIVVEFFICSSRFNLLQSVGILLENGASMFTKDTRSRNAMLHACRTARHEVVSQLLCWELVHPDDVPDTGRAVSQRDKAKRTCLHYAASAGASAALIQDLIDTDAVIVNAVDKVFAHPLLASSHHA
jgi:ankyrin repeat protein